MQHIRLTIITLILIAGALCGACASTQQKQKPTRILFIGNSLTYMGNLPAVLDALAASQGRPVQSEMIAKGGATLTQHLSDRSMQRALSDTRYDYVVFQERGGDILCAFGPASCRDAEESLGALAEIAEAHGAKAIMLGTYQSAADASSALLKAEAAMSKRLSIAYIPVSGRFQTGITSAADAQWLHRDGSHPGRDLILLEAALLYDHLFGLLPDAVGFTVHSPMSGPGSKASPYTYSAQRTAIVLAILSTSP